MGWRFYSLFRFVNLIDPFQVFFVFFCVEVGDYGRVLQPDSQISNGWKDLGSNVLFDFKLPEARFPEYSLFQSDNSFRSKHLASTEDTGQILFVTLADRNLH